MATVKIKDRPPAPVRTRAARFVSMWGRSLFGPSEPDDADGAQYGGIRFWRDPGTGTLQATVFPPKDDDER